MIERKESVLGSTSVYSSFHREMCMFNLSSGIEVVDFIQIHSKHKTNNTLGIL